LKAQRAGDNDNGASGLDMVAISTFEQQVQFHSGGHPRGTRTPQVDYPPKACSHIPNHKHSMNNRRRSTKDSGIPKPFLRKNILTYSVLKMGVSIFLSETRKLVERIQFNTPICSLLVILQRLQFIEHAPSSF
jgi:hypothetical protein